MDRFCELVKASAQSLVSKCCISQAMLVRSCGALHQLLGSTNNCERKTDAELIGDFSLNVANVAGLCKFKGMLVLIFQRQHALYLLPHMFRVHLFASTVVALAGWLRKIHRGLFVPKNPIEWNFRFDIWIGLRLQIQGLFVLPRIAPPRIRHEMHRPFTHQSSSHCNEAVTAAYFLDIGLDRLTPSHDLSALQICQLAKRLGPERAGKLEVPWSKVEAGSRRAKVVCLLPLCTTIGIIIGDCIRFMHSAS